MQKGFTLIELIFAIVIIGVLAAVAVPQFTNLKQSAEVNNLIKMVKDSESAVPSAATNMSDLENNTTYELEDILQLDGKLITYDSTTADGEYDINATATAGPVATLTFSRSSREMNTTIDCDEFSDAESESKCHESVGTSGTDTYTNTVTW